MWISGQNAIISEVGAGQVTAADTITLQLPAVTAQRYHNAQITDYHRADFRWRPPLRLRLRAKAAGLHAGTAGFGFWNHPFEPGRWSLRLPQAVWFFYGAPPNDMPLALDVPGHGWKAATFNARRWQFLALAPTAPVAFGLMRLPALYRRLWPIGQRAIGISEHPLPAHTLDDWHSYSLDWHADGVVFRVEDAVIHRAPCAPPGPLGFVAWVDNQYAIVTPQGRFGAGVSPLNRPQSLQLQAIEIERL